MLDNSKLSHAAVLLGVLPRKSHNILQRIHLIHILIPQEYLSAGFSFILYTAILLRVRGNLVILDGKWRLQFVPRSQSWQLAIGRDLIDSAMLKVAKKMVWYVYLFNRRDARAEFVDAFRFPVSNDESSYSGVIFDSGTQTGCVHVHSCSHLPGTLDGVFWEKCPVLGDSSH